MNVTRRVLSDVLCFLGVSVPLYFIYGYGRPYQRGFFCDDDTIQYPFKPSTISIPLLFLIGLGIPIFVMLICEALNRSFKSDGESHFLFGWKVPAYIVRIYKVLGIFLFGISFSILLTGIGKITTGRLRPHFIDVCNPNVDCNNPINRFRYIEDFICQVEDETLIREARFSFPSGHTSFLSFAMVYLIIYLQKRLNWHGRSFIKGALQLCCIAVCWFNALSRVSDYHHHPTDVFVGLLIGIIAACFSASYMTSLLRDSTLPLNEEWTEGNGLLKVQNWFRNK